MELACRILYTKDRKEKKRKRWKDGFLSSKPTANDRVTLRLFDELGNGLSSKTVLKCLEKDLCNEESQVYKCFASSGFQLQFDELCSSCEIPSDQNKVLGDASNSCEKKAPFSHPYTTPYSKAEGSENLDASNRFSSIEAKPQAKAFNRPRYNAKPLEREENVMEKPGPPQPKKNLPPGSLSAFRDQIRRQDGPPLSIDDEILAFFRSKMHAHPPSSSEPTTVMGYEYEYEHDSPSKGQNNSGNREAVSTTTTVETTATKMLPSLCDWSKNKSKVVHKAFSAPRHDTAAAAAGGKGVSNDRNTTDTAAGASASGPQGQPSSSSVQVTTQLFSDLSFQVAKERLVVIPTRFASIDEYKKVWIRALVEEIGMNLSQVKKKVQSWSKNKKNKKPAWLGQCKISKYEKKFHNRKEQSAADETPKYYMNFDRRPSNISSLYKMNDMWVVGRDLESLCASMKYGSLVMSVWHGLSTENKLQMEPLGRVPPLQESLVAIQGPNMQSELHMIEMFEKLEEKRNDNPLLAKILGDTTTTQQPPKDSSSLGESELPEAFTDQFSLNDSQIAFLKGCGQQINKLSEGISILHGPFGSGKTTVLVALIIFLVKHSGIDNMRVLVSANTNIAVDHVLNGLVARGFEDLTRIGSVKKIDPKLLKYTAHSKTESKKDIVRELKDMIKGASPRDKMFYQEELRTLQNDAKSKNITKLNSSKVVGVTCHSSINALLDKQEFYVAILDECSQIIEPLGMMPIIRSKAKFLVACGDQKQLPPVIASPAQSRTGHPTIFRPLFSRLLHLGYDSMMLDTQYRCHPQLGDLANRLFYNNRLKNGCDASQRPSLVGGLPPLVFADCRGSQERACGSICNKKDAVLCTQISQKLIHTGIPSQDIGIICFFREQVNKIKQELDSLSSTNNGDDTDSCNSIFVATVDSFQGNERKVIILSTTVTSNSSFISEPTRMNVALTRATNHLIIVGSAGALSAESKWSSIIRSARMYSAGEPIL